MDKEKALELLISNGYEATIEHNILYVSVVVKNQKQLNKQAQEIDKLLRENGFNRSYGWKARFDE